VKDLESEKTEPTSGYKPAVCGFKAHAGSTRNIKKVNQSFSFD